ncbi:MAG: menaquinol-cytochrome c reductase iron-sulfur subunit [Pseudoalteromonas tetraodonis]|jgi:menaquinol-cytochrome c reductase iron-sulfur subunit
MADEPDSPSEPDEKTEADLAAKSDASASGDPDRRDFMIKAGSVVFGGLVVVAPVGAGLLTFISPLMKESAGTLRVQLATVNDLPEDGTPKRFDVVAEKDDAWMRYESKPIGGVFLSRKPDGSVVAFNSSCPHAGCSVKFVPADGHYYCPCHKSEFEQDGSRGERCVSARALDTLEVDQAKLAEGEVWVTFQNFRAGIAAKKAVS